MTDSGYSGGGLDWLTPFSLFTGFGLVAAYALLGSTWLVMKTEGTLQGSVKDLARPVSNGRAGDDYRHQHLDPIVTSHRSNTVAFLAKHRLIRPGPSTGAAVLMVDSAHAAAGQPCCTVPIRTVAPVPRLQRTSYQPVAENCPPPVISIWDAAAPSESMGFTLVGALFIIPFILAYTTWSYCVFRGKVRAGEGYH